MSPKAIVLYGDGFNTEEETIFVLSKVGFAASTLHITDLLNGSNPLNSTELLVIPGGFSFGDEIRSGKVLALKLKSKLLAELNNFVDKGKFLLGICNGFQVLTSLGFLPDHNLFGPHAASLIRNHSGKFSNHWVTMTVNEKIKSPFLTGLKTLSAPVRHGEGRLVLRNDVIPIIEQFACLKYENNFSGSFDGIAALTNKTGNVFGLMPHPEAFVSFSQHPAWTEWQSNLHNTKSLPHTMPDGLIFFQNAFNALN
jgi:phosphoribosylformylglycinamidine (FGAM) synthase-like amidotransferase family enzyme